MIYYTSKDGINYELESNFPFWSQNDKIPLVDGDSMQVDDVERPKVYLDENGAVQALLVSVYPWQRKEPTYIMIRP